MQCLGLTGACAACSHCTATAWELSDLDHSHAATLQRVTRASCAQLLRSDFCAWRRLLLICWKLLIGVCVRDGFAASVCVHRTSAASVEPLPIGFARRRFSLGRFMYVGLYLPDILCPGTGRHHSGGSRGVSAGTRYGHPASFGRAYGLPVASCSAKRQAMAPTGACARARATPPLSPLSCSHGNSFSARRHSRCSPAQPAQSPGPRRARAHLTSGRARLRYRPACMLLLWVVQLMFCPQRLLPASVLQLLSVAQSSSRSLTAIAAHPLCRAVSSLEGGRGRPPEQCREREEKSGGCARRGFPRRLPQQASAAACRRAAGKQFNLGSARGLGVAAA